MADRYHRVARGWDAIYSPGRGVGHVQHTAGGGKPVRFTTKGRVTTLPRKHGLPQHVEANLRLWIVNGAPFKVELPDPKG